MFEDAPGYGPPEGDDPSPRGQILHGQTFEPAPGGDGEPTYQEGLLVDVEGFEDVESEGGTDEPRGGQRRGGTDVSEPEVSLHHPGQITVENTQDDGHPFPPVFERFPDSQTRLDVGQIGTGENGHGRGVGQVHGDMGLALGWRPR